MKHGNAQGFLSRHEAESREFGRGPQGEPIDDVGTFTRHRRLIVFSFRVFFLHTTIYANRFVMLRVIQG